MILTINNNALVSDLKEHFAKCFPGLKIEFYKIKHKVRTDSSDSDLINTNAAVGTIRRRGISGEYKIYSYHTASKLESDLYCLYGLNVQVLETRIMHG